MAFKWLMYKYTGSKKKSLWIVHLYLKIISKYALSNFNFNREFFMVDEGGGA